MFCEQKAEDDTAAKALHLYFDHYYNWKWNFKDQILSGCVDKVMTDNTACARAWQ